MQNITDHLISNPMNAFPFANRLARDNAWESSFARRCIFEYKRFCYLAMVSDYEVTPSDQVDQVWHLHMAYSRDYWDKFCGKVLGAPFHHGPTKGGDEEESRYIANYRNTLRTYFKEFDEAPPADIWPAIKVRFDDTQTLQRINTAKYLLLPIPSFLQDLIKPTQNKKSINKTGAAAGGSGCGGATGCGGGGGCGGG